MKTFLDYLALAQAGRSAEIEDPEARDLAVKALALVRDGDNTAATEASEAQVKKVKAEKEEKRGLLQAFGEFLGVCEPKEPTGQKEVPAPLVPATPVPAPAGAQPAGAAFPNTFRAVSQAATSLGVGGVDLAVAMAAHGDTGPQAVLEAVYAKAAEGNKPVPPLNQPSTPMDNSVSAQEQNLITGIRAIIKERAA